jgi:hypothetical protein
MIRTPPLQRLESPTPCVDAPALFDAVSDNELRETAMLRHRAAADLCRSCGYRVACLEEAAEARATGVFGGMLLVDGLRRSTGDGACNPTVSASSY